MGHRISHLPRLGSGASILNPNRHEFRGALSVSNDGLGKALGQFKPCGLKTSPVVCGLPLSVGRKDHARLARGHRRIGVVGRGVTIDRDGIEGPIGRGSRECHQDRHVHGGISGHVAQHGRHVGTNHAGPFRDARDDHLTIREAHPPAHGLGLGVGGHDGLRSIEPIGLGG